MNKRLRHIHLSLVLLSFTVNTARADLNTTEILSFPSGAIEAQRKYEKIFLATPNPDSASRHLRILTEEAHVAGTPEDYATALYVRDAVRGYGLEADLVEYHVYLNYPRRVSLRLTSPDTLDLSLREEGVPGDKDSFDPRAMPGFNGYAASGHVEAEVVYVNYGLPDDYDALHDLGVSVKGKIALVRYGRSFRGVKAELAEKHGAAGVIIYSDPADDGYMIGDIYPDGPMRPPSGIQRGSVQYLSRSPGDPLTPGWASTKGARRIKPEETVNLTRLPVTPLSYGEAAKILSALAGPNVPRGWQGGLPFAYHVGPGGARVEMDLDMDYAVRPIWNVIARIPGRAVPERLVVLGNHRDAWTFGAVDPNSGTTSYLEMCRGFAAAVRAGWTPERTILVCSWDGEEYGLLGSTEWVEDRAAELSEKAVMYLNVDSGVDGRDFNSGAVPSLRRFIRDVAKGVLDPATGGSVYDAWRAREWKAGRDAWFGADHDMPFEVKLGDLGSGSDYTAFLDHLGIACADMSFNGPYGVYHSIYDNYEWMSEFGDPGFQYLAAMGRVWGLAAMRAASAPVVPIRLSDYALALDGYLKDVESDGKKSIRRHAAETPDAPAPPAMEISDIQDTINAMKDKAKRLDAAVDSLVALGLPLPPASITKLNEALTRFERSFIDERGLPNRPWYRHTAFAPGTVTGYAAWPLPGLTEAVKNRDAAQFREQKGRLLEALKRAEARLDEGLGVVDGSR